jgi:hypothetical protein
MKCIATFPSYEEANERQLEILAADIDALVRYVPTGWNQAYFGTLPIYALLVPEEFSDQASELIQLSADEQHKCLYRCPKCDSNDTKEKSLEEGFGLGPFSFALTLGSVAITRMIIVRAYGRKYRCESCGAEYRKKP